MSHMYTMSLDHIRPPTSLSTAPPHSNSPHPPFTSSPFWKLLSPVGAPCWNAYQSWFSLLQWAQVQWAPECHGHTMSRIFHSSHPSFCGVSGAWTWWLQTPHLELSIPLTPILSLWPGTRLFTGCCPYRTKCLKPQLRAVPIYRHNYKYLVTIFTVIHLILNGLWTCSLNLCIVLFFKNSEASDMVPFINLHWVKIILAFKCW